MNQYETERIREALETAGFATVAFSSVADAYVINTCSVTGVADGKSRAAVRRALKLNDRAFVVVSGCYAELEPGQIAEIEGVDLVVPNDDKDAIPERMVAHFGVVRPHPSPLPQGEGVDGSRAQGERELRLHATEATGEPEVRPRLRTRAVVKVQDGCDQFCSYCTVPYARSRKSSRSLDEVMAELGSLAEFGYKEVVLAGIRLGSYDDKGRRLPDLIRQAVGIDGIERIRLSSVEPWEVDEELLGAMCSPKVCRHLHIPLQSGDDDTLARMNRPYDSARYRAIVARVRERIPGIGITTDVIAGFPGETEEAFANTCALIEEIGFSRLHVFRYSARSRTRACALPDHVDAAVKKSRAERLAELGTLAMRRFASSLVGETLSVLVEKSTPKLLTGFTDNYVEVAFPGDSSQRGEILRVRISGVDQSGGAEGMQVTGNR